MVSFDRPARFDLELVELKGVAGAKILEKAHISPHYHETLLEPGWGDQETER